MYKTGIPSLFNTRDYRKRRRKERIDGDGEGSRAKAATRKIKKQKHIKTTRSHNFETLKLSDRE